MCTSRAGRRLDSLKFYPFVASVWSYVGREWFESAHGCKWPAYEVIYQHSGKGGGELGKGGVGKTTTAASFAMGLAEQGFKTCAVDFDIGLRNLDIHLGCERRVIFDFVNVLQKEALAALIKDKRCPNYSFWLRVRPRTRIY